MVAVAFDAAVDMHIDAVNKAVGAALVAHLDPGLFIGLIQQLDPAADERHRCLI